MRRREFIAGLGGAMAWSLVARAQQGVRRVGVLMGTAEDDRESRARLAAFQEEFAKLGWVVGRNLAIDLRSAMGRADLARAGAMELISWSPTSFWSTLCWD